ncbi:SIMPL domain-containing protein [Hephaestia sp. GCM10023244]|uniref:SIMPL domain-containing protein n=1 Tax=unclassified Hephaestia TaxID=2631281 RepID=UPI0020770443|nr:SIMPL domain-containing protein [Hephaestia sp. MAHUQ-44]MCM8729724.1 SIMPL domain-containing protein [Hephaestia sp. MAHUQ-44]
MHRLAIALAAAPVAAIPAAAQTLPDATPAMLPDGTLLDITAAGKSTRVPDLATIRAGVVTQAPTAAAALSDNAQRMAGVLGALKAAGVAARDIATANVQLSPQYRYGDNQPPVITGYQATNSVSIRFRDVAKSGTILDALVKQGANQIDGPNFSLDKPDAALDEARADAVKQARARAELYANAAGLRVARIVSISESGSNAGYPPPRPVMYAMRAAAAADTPIVPGETDVTVNLQVRFLLK